MDKKTIYLSCFLFSLLCSGQIFSQELPILCTAPDEMNKYYLTHPEAKQESEEFEKYVQEFTANYSAQKNMVNCYVIPVVFHVYGTTQGGLPVNLSVIQSSLTNWVNKDFHGLNSDYNTGHSSFLSIRGNMPDVTFALAQLDPAGNPTTGVVNHAVTAGYANGTGYDAQIAADAWDNYKYMNVYVMVDLFNDGVLNNSGYAYYPSTSMSNANTARVVYNGKYLASNTSVEFASVLTHEFGHWLNLIHTFNGGCTSPNDNVSDTPPCDYSGSPYTCHTSSTANAPLNCSSQLINADNYMDYSGANGCYKMYTQGQVTRMYAALQVASRFPIWQPSNLIATGLSTLCTNGINDKSQPVLFANVYPNPSDGKITLEVSLIKDMNLKLEISDVLGRVVYTEAINMNAGDSKKIIDLENQTGGAYFLHLSSGTYSKTIKILKK